MPSRPKFFLYVFITLAIFFLSIAGTVALSFIKNNGQGKNVARNIVYSEKFHINDTDVFVGLARTNAERELGLSFQKTIAEDNGLLFVSNKPNRDGVWMKDMNFSIDVIWFDENFRVVLIKNDFSPTSYPEIIYPPVPSRYFLETKAGFAFKNKIKIGDKLEKKN